MIVCTSREMDIHVAQLRVMRVHDGEEDFIPHHVQHVAAIGVLFRLGDGHAFPVFPQVGPPQRIFRVAKHTKINCHG